jgi:hypothetical protein
MEQVRGEPASRWGPAMAALDVPRRTFVIARVVLRHTLARAAAAAGSIAQTDNLKIVGKNMAMHPAVALAIVEEVNRLASADSVTRYENIRKIADDATVKANIRLKANELLLERGAPQAQLIKVEHEHTLNIPQETQDILAELEKGFGRTLSDTAKQKLGLTQPDADVIDADFEVVAEPADEWAV